MKDIGGSPHNDQLEEEPQVIDTTQTKTQTPGMMPISNWRSKLTPHIRYYKNTQDVQQAVQDLL